MGWTESELDFGVIDRAASLGQLLRLLFVMTEGSASPKDIADVLATLDPHFTADTDTVGRWLRDERRPSKRHLQLLLRFFQSRHLIGRPPTRDRLFIRIAAFYANFGYMPPAGAAPLRHHYEIGMNFRRLRRDYERALALTADLETLSEVWVQFDRYLLSEAPLQRQLLPSNSGKITSPLPIN